MGSSAENLYLELWTWKLFKLFGLLDSAYERGGRYERTHAEALEAMLETLLREKDRRARRDSRTERQERARKDPRTERQQRVNRTFDYLESCQLRESAIDSKETAQQRTK